MNFDAVIFDLDGVITQTALVHGAAWKRMFDEYLRSREQRFGEPFREFTHAGDYLPYVDGKPRYQGVASFLESRKINIPFGDPSDPPDAETVCGLGNRKNLLFNAVLDEEGVKVYPATIHLIHDLKDAGIRLGVASSSKNCKPVLEKAGLIDFFEVRIDGVVSAEINLKGKPEPDIFTVAADRMGVSYHRSVVVEDAVSGVQAGRKGNFGLVIGVAREDNARELRNNGGDIVVGDLEEISVETINRWFEKGLPEDNWHLTYYDYELSKERSREALLTIGNGYFGTRGAMEESRANKINYPATYFAGLYNRLVSKVGDRDIKNEDFVNAVNWLPVTFGIGKDPWFTFDPDPSQKILTIERCLDFRTGELTRELIVEDRLGRQTRISSSRLASMDDPHLAGIAYRITPLNYSGEITIRAGLTADHINAGVERYSQLNQQHLVTENCETLENKQLLRAKTTSSAIHILAVSEHRVRNMAYVERNHVTTRDKVFTSYLFDGKKDQTIVFEKTVVMGISLHPGFDKIESFFTDAKNHLPEYQTLADNSAAVWKEIHKKADIRIEGDRTAQKLTRLHTYHLFVSASPYTANLDVGIPPRGLHGEAYRGHIFWDELFFLPFYLVHYPEVAGGVLKYRYRRLDKAREYARQHGYQGAMFPWQSGSDGGEETQVVHLNPVSGEWGEDYSSLQRHVSLAIGYNLWNYYHYTGDREFMEKYGAEMLLEMCRFWVSACRYDAGDDRYHIDKVMGPDEFHEKLPGSIEGGLTDNAYTNILTHWLLDKGVRLAKDLRGEVLERIIKKTGITKAEIDSWTGIRNKLNINISKEGIIEQFAGYFGLAEIDLEEYKKKYNDIHRMDRILKAEGKSPDAFKVSKQADLLMAFYLLGEEEVTGILQSMGYSPPANYLARNYQYYLARTSHGSTLSRLVYSTIAFHLGRKREGWKMFMDTLNSDLEDIQGGTTGEGIHCGVMGGTVNAVMTVFGGLRLNKDKITICPEFPEHWESLDYRFRFRNDALVVSVNPDKVRIIYFDGEKMKIKVHICKLETDLQPGEDHVFKLK
ncbi:MAG: beta-phosphoglucomutase family hydrolase [Chlorobi bacterium]|nr:beta-phosphoglucomutase family hydrolase [Chlorobiota bacterium]